MRRKKDVTSSLKQSSLKNVDAGILTSKMENGKYKLSKGLYFT